MTLDACRVGCELVTKAPDEKPMIDRYNRIQMMKAVLLLPAGAVCCVLAYLFFRHVPALVASSFGLVVAPQVAQGIGLLGLGASWLSGYRMWKARGGLFSYHDSGLYHDLGEETGGAAVAGMYMHRVTGPAYLLGQVFMAGPQCILRALTLLKSRIPWSSQWEARLKRTLEAIRAANRWQGLGDHPGSRTEILHLAQMGLIDFSDYHGTPRFKAR